MCHIGFHFYKYILLSPRTLTQPIQIYRINYLVIIPFTQYILLNVFIFLIEYSFLYLINKSN